MDLFRDLNWATSAYYHRRAHLVFVGAAVSLCGIPVHHVHDARPQGLRVCPECAISFTSTVFPTESKHLLSQWPPPLGTTQ